jgi:hypothetical protein
VIDFEMVVLDPEQFTSMLLERRAAVASTQSQHRSRKNGGLTQLLALEQSVAPPVLCS